MSRRTEIQVGATVIVALIVLVGGVTYLKQFSLGKKLRTWHVVYPQAGGLGEGDEVQVNGIPKGTVKLVALMADHVTVDLELAADVVITHDSKVVIRNLGMMGDKVIYVDLKTTGPAYTERDTIQGVFELGMGEVMASMGPTMSAMDAVSRNLERLSLRIEKDGDVEKTLSNFRATSQDLREALRENRAMLHQTIGNLNEVSKTAKVLTVDREAQLKRTLDNFERSSSNLERLSARMDSLRASLQSVTDKVDRGEGSLGALINDKTLYSDVTESVKSMKLLIEDIKLHPRKYINLTIF
ncbi:MAG: MlaD family protein [Candidatus Eisenbacteria bacterium]